MVAIMKKILLVLYRKHRRTTGEVFPIDSNLLLSFLDVQQEDKLIQIRGNSGFFQAKDENLKTYATNDHFLA